MIKLEANQMTKAIERAKAARPKVRVISADNRTYAVTGSKGDVYTVRFAVANGHKLAECDCPARGLCYHVAAAAAVNIGIQSMRRQAASAPAPTRESLITSIKSTWSKNCPNEDLGLALLRRFKCNDLRFLADDMLTAVLTAIA